MTYPTNQNRSAPNSADSDDITPQSLEDQATYPGTRYGPMGSHPGEGDNSRDCIISDAAPGM